MANDGQQAATQQQAAAPARMDLNQATARLVGFIEQKEAQIVQLLGGGDKYDRFKSVVTMAIHRSPDLLKSDVKSFIDACLACASDGLMPDGKRAALVVFNDRRNNKMVVNYIPMIRGIIECLHRTGYVRDVQAEVVYRGEPFVNIGGLDPRLEHAIDVDIRDQSTDKDIIYAYAVVRTINGGVYPKVLTRKEIDKVKAIAKTDKVWGPWYSEMAKKTAIRNLSKSLPFDLEVFTRDDSMYDLTQTATLPPRESRKLLSDPRNIIEPDEPEQAKTDAEAPQAPAPEPPPPDTSPEQTDQPEAPEAPADAGRTDEPDLPPAPPVDDDDEALPPLLTKAIEALREVQGWADLTNLMTQLWERSAWAPIEKSGFHKRLYELIKTTPAFKGGDPAHIVHKRIMKG